MVMMKHKYALIFILAGFVLIAPMQSSSQPQRFAETERAMGNTNNDWAFMTAWDLTSGDLAVSPTWYNGDSVWNFDQPHLEHWIAKFIYDQISGSTRELQWSYTQEFVQ